MASGPRGRRRAARSGRPGDRRMDAAQRPRRSAACACRSASSASSTKSRPNVTADAGALCLKSGNAAILRGGSESFHSSRAIVACCTTRWPTPACRARRVQLVPTTDRAAVGEMLRMPQCIDLIVPRGGKSLIERVQRESRIPVIAHLEGLCHVYVDGAADLAMARDDRAQRQDAPRRRLRRRRDPAGRPRASTRAICRRSCATCSTPAARCAATPRRRRDRQARQAGDRRGLGHRISRRRSSRSQWSTASTARSRHIERHGSHHTDSIVTDDAAAAERFLDAVDSAIVLCNASTQFADGGEFGMGAEIGISTSKLHARGPVGAEQLTSFKIRRARHRPGQAVSGARPASLG